MKTSIRLTVLVCFCLGFVLAIVPVIAGNVHEVNMIIEEVPNRPVPEFYFEPVGLYIEPGDTIQFNALSPHHTVTAYHPLQGKHPRVPDGTEPFSSPMVPIGQSWEYTFTIPGVYDVFCGPHEMYGMAMRIVVGEVSGPGALPVEDFSPEGAMGTAGSVLNDPALNAERVLKLGAVSWHELAPESKAIQD